MTKGTKKTDAQVNAKSAGKTKTAKPKAQQADKVAKIKKPRGLGIGVFVCERIKAGDSVEQVLKAVEAKFPGSKTTDKCVYYYRSQLNKKGQLPKAPAKAKSA